MPLEVTPVGKDQYRIHGTVTGVKAAQDTSEASIEIDLSRHPSLIHHRYLRVHLVKTGGAGAAIVETVIANASNFGGDPTVTGIKVQLRLTPLSGQPTVVNEQLNGAPGQCVGSRRLWLFPGPDTGTDNVFDVDIHLLAGWH